MVSRRPLLAAHFGVRRTRWVTVHSVTPTMATCHMGESHCFEGMGHETDVVEELYTPHPVLGNEP
jgi:hypothetical protein